MITLTAAGSGYYIISVDGVDVSRHITEREAAEGAFNRIEISPTADVRYRHDYSVSAHYSGPVPPTVPTPVPDQPPAYLFETGFEEADPRAGWQDWDTKNASGQEMNWGGLQSPNGDYIGAGYNSQSCLRLNLPANTVNTIYPAHNFNGADVDDTVVQEFMVYYSPGFEFNTNSNKLSYLMPASQTGWRVALQARPQIRGPSVDITSAIPCFHFYCGSIEVTPGSPEAAYCYDSGGDLRYFPNVVNDFRLTTGRWYKIRWSVTPNPSGQGFGGRLRLWIDDVLISDYSNVSVRPATDTQAIGRIWFTGYYGGGGQTNHPDQFILIDDVKVWKE